MSSDLPELRASHADRDRVVDTLRTAGGDGRLTAEELDGRLEQALTARTQRELVALVADLPPAAGPEALVITQRGGSWKRAGRWVVPPRIEVRTQLCRVRLDLTEAELSSSTLRIEVAMEHGALVIIGPPGTVVDANGLSLTFSRAKLRPDAGTGARLRIELAGTLKHAKVVQRERG